MGGPEVTSHPLAHADGSVTYSDSVYSIIASACGPYESGRRDELPDEAAIEVNVRPASGVGGPRERWLESVISPVLRSVLLVHLHPRMLVQITLQVTKGPSVKLNGAVQDTALLPSLLNAAFLALVDAGLPLETTLSAVLCAVSASGDIVMDPTEKQLANCSSLHALAYNQHGQQLLNESYGVFDLETWEHVADESTKHCRAAVVPSGDDAHIASEAVETTPWLRRELEGRVRDTSAWRGEG